MEEKLSWLMEWDGWDASFSPLPLYLHPAAIWGSGGRRGSEAPPCSIRRKMQEMVKQYDPGTGVLPTKFGKCTEAGKVAKYKWYDAVC